MNYSGMGGPESAAGGGGGINNGAHNGGNSGVNDAPISNTLQNRSALLRAIHTTERLRKRQEKEQIEDALRNPSNNHPSGGKGRSPMNLNYRSQSRQSRQSSSSSGSSKHPNTKPSQQTNTTTSTSTESLRASFLTLLTHIQVSKKYMLLFVYMHVFSFVFSLLYTSKKKKYVCLIYCLCTFYDEPLSIFY